MILALKANTFDCNEEDNNIEKDDIYLWLESSKNFLRDKKNRYDQRKGNGITKNSLQDY